MVDERDDLRLCDGRGIQHGGRSSRFDLTVRRNAHVEFSASIGAHVDREKSGGWEKIYESREVTIRDKGKRKKDGGVARRVLAT